MADALVSPAVATVTGMISVGLIIAAARRIKRSDREGLTSMMGVLAAFVFAAQMINFTIPGTGSSGHIIGGVLLSAVLGPWAGFIALCSVLIVQCLVFADGGLMALGCNILNMAATSCLVAYPLIYKPMTDGWRRTHGRIMAASIMACTLALMLGAFMVTVETELSGITALPFAAFLGVMLPIHIVIGACEGVATGLVLTFVLKNSPSMLAGEKNAVVARCRRRNTLVILGVAAAVMAGAFTWIASSNPDGLEWSIGKILGDDSLAVSQVPVTAIIPDYQSYFAGIIGTVIVLALIWVVCTMLFRRKAVCGATAK